MRKTVRRREVKAKARSKLALERRKLNLVIDAHINELLRAAGIYTPVALGVPKRRKA